MTATATASQAQKERIFSVAEYIEHEARTGQKHQFQNGKLIKMAGASVPHNRIARNILTEVDQHFKSHPQFEILSSDQKIYLPKYNFYVYPDAVVVAEGLVMSDKIAQAIINPLLIVEVLSPSTEEHDRGQKFLQYRSLPSFKEYVLVRQDAPEVLTFFKEKPGVWLENEFEGLETEAIFQSIDFRLALSLIYRNVAF